MKALTITQPWANLIMFHGKDIENRDWAAPRHLLGQRIAIHSSKKLSNDDLVDAAEFVTAIGRPDLKNSIFTVTRESCGVILGTALLSDCTTDSASPWFCGHYGFILRDPEPLAVPIPIRGQLGFWECGKIQI